MKQTYSFAETFFPVKAFQFVISMTREYPITAYSTYIYIMLQVREYTSCKNTYHCRGPLLWTLFLSNFQRQRRRKDLWWATGRVEEQLKNL